MNTNNHKPLAVAVVLVNVLFLLLGIWAMTGGMMKSWLNNRMNGSG